LLAGKHDRDAIIARIERRRHDAFAAELRSE
jgi:hypothetical protein